MAPLTLTLTSFFPPGNSVWVSPKVRTTLSQLFPLFVPNELWRLAQASLQAEGHPSHKALEEVFKFIPAKKPQRTINLTHCQATTWGGAAGNGGGDTEPVFGTISLLWALAQSFLGPDAAPWCQPSIPQPPLLPQEFPTVQTLWDQNQPLQEWLQ